MIFVSPFTPLFFSPSTDIYGADSHYLQLFSPSDIIFIEVIGVDNTDPVNVTLNYLDIGTSSVQVMNTWIMNEHYTLHYCFITGTDEGKYSVTVNGAESEPFLVTSDDELLDRTTLIEYSMRDNRQRQDGVFVINGVQQFFQFRAPGGFKDDGWQFGVDNEQFNTLESQVAEVFSADIVQKQFTLGNAEGCPVWYASLLNRIMSCSYIIIGDERYVRAGTSTPEQTQSIVGKKAFIFKQLMQKVDYYDDNMAWRRDDYNVNMAVRIANDDLRITEDSLRKI